MLIFDKSTNGSISRPQAPYTKVDNIAIDKSLLRQDKPNLPTVSELEVVRHYTNLSHKNFSIDTNCYPLGSCTMKYNPRGAHKLASLPGMIDRHPLAHELNSQGLMGCLYGLQQILIDLTGMAGISLTPMAGAQGEFAGVAMIKAFHQANNDSERCEIIVPYAAHGTNPATASMCGYKVREIPTKADGDINIEVLKSVLGPKTAGIMLTNPSTLGVFERRIEEVSKLVHQAGGLLYYDGANLNAIMGKVKPGDMGFDVMHINLHKTFATPHGGGGPGSGPIAVGKRLLPYMPTPFVSERQGVYYWATEQHVPQTIGRLSAFMGNAGILVRAFIYAKLLGKNGLVRATEYAVLNANYLMVKLSEAGFTVALPERRATHEFIISLQPEAKAYGVTALDFAKGLLDYGIHAPTMYFPTIVPECLLIEPTETESKQQLDTFVEIMVELRDLAKTNPEQLKSMPLTTPIQRLDDVKAARELNLTANNKCQK